MLPQQLFLGWWFPSHKLKGLFTDLVRAGAETRGFEETKEQRIAIEMGLLTFQEFSQVKEHFVMFEGRPIFCSNQQLVITIDHRLWGRFSNFLILCSLQYSSRSMNNGLILKWGKFRLEIGGTFCCEGGQALEQTTQRNCGLSNLAHFQDLVTQTLGSG